MQISRTQAALSSEAKADRKVSKMIFIMILFFLIAWTPYTAFSLYVTFGKNVTITPLAGTFPPFFAKLCTIHNPIIYFLLNKQVWTFFICGSYCEYSLTLYINNFFAKHKCMEYKQALKIICFHMQTIWMWDKCANMHYFNWKQEKNFLLHFLFYSKKWYIHKLLLSFNVLTSL